MMCYLPSMLYYELSNILDILKLLLFTEEICLKSVSIKIISIVTTRNFQLLTSLVTGVGTI